MNKLICILLISMLYCNLYSQRDLKKIEDDATALLESFSSSPNKIERATLTKEDERSVTVSLRFSGFDDKEYKLQVAVLDQRKEPMRTVTPVQADMPKSRQADITLNMSDSGQPLNSASLTSKFLRITVAPKTGGVSGAIEELFEGFNPNATEYFFELDKKWMVMGASVHLNAILAPYKNAATISPN